MDEWLAGWLAGWRDGWLDGWPANKFAGSLVEWLANVLNDWHGKADCLVVMQHGQELELKPKPEDEKRRLPIISYIQSVRVSRPART